MKAKVTGKVVDGVPCLVFVYEGIHFTVSIDGSTLIATW